MTSAPATKIRQRVTTASGYISYTEAGHGPVALFVHGVLVNGMLLAQRISGISDQDGFVAHLFRVQVNV